MFPGNARISGAQRAQVSQEKAGTQGALAP